MRDLPHKGALAACAALAVGEAAGFACGPLGPLWLFAALAAASAALFGFQFRRWRIVAVALAGAALALRSECARSQAFDEAESTNGPFVCEIKASSRISSRGEWTSFQGSWKGIDLEVRARDICEPPRRGEVWRCAGWLERRPREDRRRRALWVTGTGSHAECISRPSRFSLPRAAEGARRRLSAAASIGLDGPRRVAVSLNRAMLLGERAGMDRKLKETFIAAGAMHLFAVSGLHVGVVLVVIWALLRLLRCPFRLQALLALPAVWAYAYMIGMPPSASRAATMATFYLLAPLFMRRRDALAAWARTLLLFHAISPERLFDVGSAMSFTVVFGILAADRLAKSLDMPFAARSLFMVFAAWAAGVPIAAHVFGRVVPGGLLANLLLMPLAGVSLSLALVGAAVSCAVPFIGAYFNNAAALVTDAMRGIAWAVSRLPLSSIETGPWSAWQCAAWYLVVVLAALLVYLVVTRRRNYLVPA